MNWFSKKKQAIDTQTSISTSTGPTVKTAGMIWLETSSEEVYLKTLDNMYQEFKEIRTFPGKTDTNNARVYVQVFLNKIRKLDRNRMSSEQKRDLAMIVFGSYPRAVARMETQLSDIDEMYDASDELGDTLRSYMEKYLDSMPRKIPVPNQLTQPQTEKEDSKEETIGDKEADAKLETVEKLALEAYRLSTSVEDRYFAETSANSYIPDSVRMLKGLMNAPDDLKSEAKELFLKQLGIIETQLNTIVNRSAINSLSEMKAHTEFLESKEERKSSLDKF